MMEPFLHQSEAVEKLRHQPSVAFFDDMGVGKTVEAIMIDRIRREEGLYTKTLVVTIAGAMVDSWARHFSLWEPDLKVVTLNPKDRNNSWSTFNSSKADVFIMHWDALRLMPSLADVSWLHIIADEVHRISARDTQMTKALKKIRKVEYKTALSGTPTTGAPHMMWSILNWLYPKTYTSYWKFYEKYIYWQMDDSGRYRKIIGVNEEKLPELQAELSEFSVRRLLRDVRKDMPDRLPPEQIFVDLLPIQRKAYNQMRDEMIAWVIEKAAEEGTDEITNPIVAQAAVSRLVRLLQFTCAYAQVGDDHKVHLSEPSSKLDTLMQTKIIPAYEEDVKLVVFSDFRQLIELLNVRLEKAGIPYATIHGNVPQSERNSAVQFFQTGKALVATITKAGGTGIDLFAGSRIVFLSRDWSPGVNDQAIGRIDRIGQTNPIQVTDITSTHTIETEKNRTIDLKWSWMRKVLGDG